MNWRRIGFGFAIGIQCLIALVFLMGQSGVITFQASPTFVSDVNKAIAAFNAFPFFTNTATMNVNMAGFQLQNAFLPELQGSGSVSYSGTSTPAGVDVMNGVDLSGSYIQGLPTQNTAFKNGDCSSSLVPSIIVSRAGDALFITFDSTGAGPPTVSGITDNNGGTWALAKLTTDTVVDAEIWYSLNHATGTTAVTVALSAGSGGCFDSANLSDFSGVATSGALDASATHSVLSSTSTISTNSTSVTVAAKELVLATAAMSTSSAGQNPSFLTVNPTNTLQMQEPQLGTFGSQSTLSVLNGAYAAFATGAQQVTWTTNVNVAEYRAAIATFKMAGANPNTGTLRQSKELLASQLAGTALTSNSADYGSFDNGHGLAGNVQETSTILIPTGSSSLNTGPGQHQDADPASGMLGLVYHCSAHIDNQGTTAVTVPNANMTINGRNGTWYDTIVINNLTTTIAPGATGMVEIEGESVGIGEPHIGSNFGVCKVQLAATQQAFMQVTFIGTVLPVFRGLNPDGMFFVGGIGGMIE